MTPPDQIPVIPVQHEAVWINSALSLLSMRPVAYLHAPPPLNCHAERQHYFAVRLWRRRPGGEDYGRLNALEARWEPARPNTTEPGKPPLHRRRGGAKPHSPRRQEAATT